MAHVFNDDNFDEEVLRADKPVLVDFFAEWCGPCKMMAPVIDELAKEMEGKVVVGKLNVDESPNTAGKYGVQSIPTTILFKKGEEVDRMVGFQSKEAFKAKLAE
ncbi:thioredoxin [Candidatus Peregrinibacteria bacterium]|jgi:thioredoxin 1|nr:thioredoxin [Candidatus Peregrinibacteria bacterium]MBT4148720.1 thioredoxin [Candidatus Peregrinibacteria bacterium]MBT4366211.1 thioredoxin [Candidatus Peregrinibacteria bacterium]MBT4456281.1 thioredoxin [Candidatus Peregrinibacteria bacterium]